MSSVTIQERDIGQYAVIAIKSDLHWKDGTMTRRVAWH